MVKALIYSTALCSYCVAAKNFLKSRGIAYEEIRIDSDPAKQEEMVKRTQRRSVPQIFINERHIGGYEDLVQFDQRGELAQLMKENQP